jgi:hypothetical protein
MVAGADSIEDMGLVGHGGIDRVFAGACAPPPTLGLFLRAFTFGHVRQGQEPQEGRSLTACQEDRHASREPHGRRR